MAIPRADSEERVTFLELFFDLVFVFAITQVTALMAKEADWAGVGQGMLVLAALWWAWAGYAWLTNRINPEEGAVRLVVFVAMAVLLIASLAVPRAFGSDAEVFGVAYLGVRVLHIALFSISTNIDDRIRSVVHRLAVPQLLGGAIVCVACFLDGPAQYVVFGLALIVDYGGLLLIGVSGWRLHPAHFAERHSLIIIIALGESIVALGVGAGDHEVTASIAVCAGLGVAVAAALWWAYFDVVALVAERRLSALSGDDRSRMARDSWTYLHLPMVAGIILFALGVKKTLAHVDEPLTTVGAFALCGGVALYLAALVAFRLRNVGTLNKQRTLTVAVLLALIPVAHRVDALPALAIVALASCGLIAYEAIRFRDVRDRVRHAQEIAVSP
jgi:low temperature requirement protein LtrA